MNSKEEEKIIRSKYKSIIEQATFNQLHKISRHRNFTGSDIIDLIGGHATDPLFQSLIQARMRKLAKKGIAFDHSSGKPQKIYVKVKGQYGRTNRPSNLYKMKAA